MEHNELQHYRLCCKILSSACNVKDLPQLWPFARTKQPLATHRSPCTGQWQVRQEEKPSSFIVLAASKISSEHAGQFLYLCSVLGYARIITMVLQCVRWWVIESNVSVLVWGNMLCWKSKQAYILPPPPHNSFLSYFTMWLTHLVLSMQQFLILDKWRKSNTRKQNRVHVRRERSPFQALSKGCILQDPILTHC